MKVLFFSNVSLNIEHNDIYGSGNWATSLIKTINKYYNKIDILFAYHDAKIKKIEISTFHNNITIIKIPTDIKKNKIGKLVDSWIFKDANKSSLVYYEQIINNFNPDIIQIFGLESPFIRLIGKTGIPVVIHIQGFLSSYLFKFYPRFTIFQILLSSKFKILFKAQTPIHQKINYIKHLQLEKNVYSKCQYFLGRTDWDRFVAKAVAPDAKYFYCQEIMRDPFYTSQWQQKNHKRFRIFTTIREAFYKNIDIIFEVSNLFEIYHPNFSYEWYIAGIDKNDISVRLMTKKGYKSNHIILLGKIGADSLVKGMLQSDLFVFPSAIENSPNALQEAMLVGMPIVATYAGGVSSLIEHGKTGYLVPEGEPYSLTGAIIELKANKELMNLLGENARNIAFKRNDPYTVVTSLINIYDSIIF